MRAFLPLAITQGNPTGFVGANGAGKTTAIQLMPGLLRGDKETLFLGRRRLYEWGAPGTIVGAVLGAGHPSHRLRAHLRCRRDAGAR